MGIKKHLNSKKVAGDTQDGNIMVSPSSFVAARTIHMEGRDVLIINVYCKDGDIGLCMEVVAKITRNGTLPYLIIGNFNQPPRALRESMWVKEMGAKVLTAENDAVTCFLKKGTCIDYVIASPMLPLYPVRE